MRRRRTDIREPLSRLCFSVHSARTSDLQFSVRAAEVLHQIASKNRAAKNAGVVANASRAPESRPVGAVSTPKLEQVAHGDKENEAEQQ